MGGTQVELVLDTEESAQGKRLVIQFQIQLVFSVIATEQQIRPQRPVPDQGGIGREVADLAPYRQ